MKKFAVMLVLHKMSTFKSYYMVLVMALGGDIFLNQKRKRKRWRNYAIVMPPLTITIDLRLDDH